MIERCPFCGYELNRPVLDGLGYCGHCNRIVDSTLRNRLLSASWCLRRKCESYPAFQFHTRLLEHEAEFIYGLVAEDGHTHDEVLEILNGLGIV